MYLLIRFDLYFQKKEILMKKKLLMHICVLAVLIYKRLQNLESQMFLDFGIGLEEGFQCHLQLEFYHYLFISDLKPCNNS